MLAHVSGGGQNSEISSSFEVPFMHSREKRVHKKFSFSFAEVVVRCRKKKKLTIMRYHFCADIILCRLLLISLRRPSFSSARAGRQQKNANNILNQSRSLRAGMRGFCRGTNRIYTINLSMKSIKR